VTTHLFLSPHLDDAVLSCGGVICELLKAGEQVDVLTVVAADTPVPVPQSALVAALHTRWGLGDNPFLGRRQEDREALTKLGAVGVHFGDWHDCIYRTDSRGQLLYTTEDQIFGKVHPADPLQNASLDLSLWPNITHLYAPLGAGNHVDHQLVRQSTLQWLKNAHQVAFFLYEEYPYSSEEGEIFHTFGGEEARLSGVSAIAAARATLPGPTVPYIWPLSESTIQTKISAIMCYHSQISSFWNDVAEMTHRVRNNARGIGRIIGAAYGERLWVFDSTSGELA
jgi:LmbE family N-acetylglucosaminyl deacetylase